MIHYACDRCKCVLAGDDLRYVVKLETYAAIEPLEEDFQDDRDHLLEIHEILERIEDDDSELIDSDIYQKRRFDLCPNCYRQYAKDPLGQETPAHLGFSHN